MDQLQRATGIKGIRKVSPTTVVVDTLSGSCRPASDLERRMWSLLLGLKDKIPDEVPE
jgi:hypothetical protein